MAIGGCSGCLGSAGFTAGEATRSASMIAAGVIRQVAAVAIAVDNANQLRKNYKAQRDIANRNLRLAERQQGQLQNVFWPREILTLQEFGDEQPIEAVETFGRRYAGRLTAGVAGQFAQQLHQAQCEASRYCTSSYNKQVQDLLMARATGMAAARTLGRNIGFHEYQARNETNINRRRQAIAMGRQLAGQAASLLSSASNARAGSAEQYRDRLNQSLEMFGQGREQYRMGRGMAGRPQPGQAYTGTPGEGGNSAFGTGSWATGDQTSNFQNMSNADAAAANSSNSIQVGRSSYDAKAGSEELSMALSQGNSDGGLGQLDLVRSGKHTYRATNKGGPIEITVDMSHFKFADVRNKGVGDS